ncbi:cysteine dioxygenase [Paenibacillus sp. GCM10023248]|uniref:cysteine dioxygenase n=1 Tax=Bacillales TaxID=1385 RepID=UPI00237973BE|nr:MULTISPECIES: cysteine dioxygenase family protein [Bacillales]MDD9267704.1 cysteine dioxygenase family protein [Paenibacillus sp. MAHUQ-63]MDR6884516.1 cysteine dioxygenase [Bacillus sp. 3255]
MTLLKAVEQTFCKLQAPDLEQLAAALRSLETSFHEIASYKTEPNQLPYGRNVIYRNDDVEVIVIHIPAFSATAIHNHGTSVGAAYLAQGTIVNSKFSLDYAGYPVVQADDMIKAGEYFTAPPDQIHQLNNPFHEPTVSLHVYSPPLDAVNRYLPYSEVLDYVI